MFVIYDPRTNPMIGERPSIDPMATGPGEFLSLINFSGNRFRVAKRWGCTLVGSSRPFTGAKFRGCSSQIFVDGAETCLVAFEDPGVAVRIYSLNLASYAWTEVSAAATRFTTIANVQFLVHRDPGDVLNPGGVDIVIAGNGTDDCRVITRIGGTFAIGVASAVSIPTVFQPTVQPYPECWFEIKNPADVSYPTASGAFAGAADSGASTNDNESNVPIGTGATGTLEIAYASASQLDANDYTVNTAAGAFDLTTAFGSSAFVGILVEDTLADPIFGYVSVELRDGATYRPVWNPSATGKILPTYLPAGDGCYLAVFDMSPYRANLSSYINMDRMRWVIDHALPSARTVNIIGVYGMGAVPAGAQHAVLYQNRTTMVESGARVPKKLPGPTPVEVGGNINRTITLPEGAAGQNVGWTPIIRIAKPPTGVQVSFYRKDPIDFLYYHTGVYQLTSASAAFGAKHDRIEPSSKYFARKVAYSGNQPPPKGQALCASGGRAFVGGLAGNRGQIWASDRRYPLRFVGLARDQDYNGEIDDDSGAVIEMPGENVVRMLPMPNVYNGFAPVLAWTNAALWVMEGPDPISLANPGRLNPHGTLYPLTVATHKFYVYYVDAEKQARVYSPGGRDSLALGIWHNESRFEEGDCFNATGWLSNERYRVAFRQPDGTLNKQVCFYEERTKGWFTHRYTTPDFAFVFVQQVAGTAMGSFSTAHGSKQIAISQEGYVYRLEVSGTLQDAHPGGNEAITVELSKYLHSGSIRPNFNFRKCRFAHPWVIWEKSTDGVLTATFNTPADVTEDGANNTGTLKMDENVADEVWRYFYNSTDGSRPGVASYGCTLTITGNPASGKALRGIGFAVAELIDKEGGGADVNG